MSPYLAYMLGCVTPVVAAVIYVFADETARSWRTHQWDIDCPECEGTVRIPHLIPHRISVWLVRRGLGTHNPREESHRGK